jgi:hypothetical protein
MPSAKARDFQRLATLLGFFLKRTSEAINTRSIQTVVF